MTIRRFEVLSLGIDDRQPATTASGSPRLTITSERVTLKFPPDTDGEIKNRVTVLAHAIDDETPLGMPSLRGRFHTREEWFGCISLLDAQKKVRVTFSPAGGVRVVGPDDD